ncbi:hypothetical protein WJX84_000993 [Apatococcus fuscideae]|uniref:Translation initiation factor IF-2, chloroplastic n=1 Tax=Apatococcus fuscideae TaxID=2026836 RepID=A0AAW1T0N6_9CHLO
MTVKQLASGLGMDVAKLMASMAEAGDAASTEEERVPLDTAELMALEYNHIPTVDKTSRAPDLDAEPRSAVVTVMGHVDHGKTTLLDALRSTAVAAGEAGGITQHIGAFEVVMPGSKTALTFLDTPGHAAFSAMRARGAAVTDIAVVVVAADDGVMPQTKEALRHAKSAGVPVVIGLTKCDAPGADTQKCINQLLAEGLPLEEAGGDIQVVELAAAKGKGLAELEEALHLQAEMMELKASKSCDAEGLVVEAKVDRTQGPAATVVVKRGTLRAGQYVVIGTEHGRVRALRDAAGKPLKHAGPGQPAEIIGLRGVPHAGDELMVVSSEERARLVSQARTNKAVEFRHAQSHESILEASSASDEEAEETVTLPLIVQADVHGSAEALQAAIEALSTDTVRIKILHMGVGPVSKANIDEAAMTNARIIAFNVKTNGPGVEAANKVAGVQITSHRVIYHLLEDVRGWTQAMTPKVEKEVVSGEADVLQVFPVTQKGEPATSVAGCRVSSGTIAAALSFRVLRNEQEVHTGPCSSIRRHKLGVERVGRGTECGLLLTGFAGFQPGDRVQCYEIQMVDPEPAAEIL